MKSQLVAGALLFAAGLVATQPAHAVVVPDTPTAFDNVGDSFSLNFSNGFADGTALAGLTSEAVFRLSSVAGGDGIGTGNSWTFAIDKLANTSAAPTTQARLVGFGFDVAPNVSSIGATGMFDAGFTNPSKTTSISNGLKVEVCFFDVGGNNCAGGGNGGLWGGQSVTNELIPNALNPTNSFTLNFASVQDSITLNSFVVRYQSIGNMAGVSGTSGVGVVGSYGPVTDGPVPEPASWAMLIAGFGLVGGAMRRRQSKQKTLIVA